MADSISTSPSSSDLPVNPISNPPTTATSSTSTSGLTKEGFLEKKGAVNKNWRERYFYLSNGQLDYFVDKERQKKKGSISLADVTEIGPLSHETRSFCFGLNSGKRLWVLSADSNETRESWMSVLRSYQPKSLAAGTAVPHTAIGSFKKTIVGSKSSKKKKGDTIANSPPGNTSNSPTQQTISSSNTPSNVSNSSLTTSPATSSSTSPATSPASNNPLINNNTVNSDSVTILSPTQNQSSSNLNPTSMTSDQNSTVKTAPVTIPNLGVPSSIGPNSPQQAASPPNSPTAPVNMLQVGSPLTARVTMIVSNEPRATMLQPTSFATWNPKLAWNPTPERPAWCYELSPNLPPELTAWLSPLLSAATRFNMGWAFVLDWVRRIGNANFPNPTILENIKQGLAKLTPCWHEFDKALKFAEAWDATHPAVSKLKNQIAELHTLADTKVSGWHVQLSSKVHEESKFELTYRRDESGTPERPAWFFTPNNVSVQVAESFKLLEQAAAAFNDCWAQAYEAARQINATNKQNAPNLKEQITRALTQLEPCWKEFDNVVASFEAWNALSLYTLEVKQQLGSLKRLYESSKRDWLLTLDSRASIVPASKSEYNWDHDKPTPEKPAWFYKFSLNTPSDISRCLVVLSTAANIFNSNWSTAIEWANKIGKNMATRAAIREGIFEAFGKLEACWPEFENAIKILEPWENACAEVTRQVSQLRGLVEESKEQWLGRLATSTEITPMQDFRLSVFGPESSNTSFQMDSPSGSEKIPVSMTSTITDDARLMYENCLAANREAASLTEQPDAKLNFVPGLGPGSFRNSDIYRAVLQQLYRAQQIPNTAPELVEQIRSLIVETQQLHKALCFKWAIFYAREGNMARSIEYYEALVEVLPDAVVELDKELALLKAEFTANG